jgi:hypothetical protein
MQSFRKAKDILFWLIIFLLPTQLAYHFWPDFSFVSGFRIDYLSPTIYLTDILIFLYIIFSFVKQGVTIKKAKLKIKSLPAFFEGSDLIGIFLFILFALLNILFSASISLTIISWIRIVFYLLFFLSLKQEKNLIKKIQTPLILSTILIIGIEVVQLIKQESLNGIFYWLGERKFNLSTPNIAKIKINFEFLTMNSELLRPYATFSHPNSLAGYLLLTFIITKKDLLGRWPNGLLRGGIFLGIFLTFSKAAILSLLAIFIYQKLKPKFQPIFLKIILFSSLVISVISLLTNQLPLPFRSFSVGGTILSRLYLGPPTLQIIKDNLFFGVGLNNFIPSLSEELSASHIFINTLQPIHSISLLAFSELGLVGIVFLIILIKKTNKNYQTPKASLLLIVLAITGSVDHYWWTLHQNQLMIVLVLALLISPPKVGGET